MKYFPDLLLVAGAGLLAYGAWLVHQPSGFIVGGILVLAQGLAMARNP